MDKLEELRAEIQKYFSENNCIGLEDSELSNGRLYHFTSETYLQITSDRNWIVSKIEIYKTGCSIPGFKYITNYDSFGFCWIHKNNIDYLILPEILGGQSIYNTKTKQLHSFYDDENPFIWYGIHPSPDANKIAVLGCYFMYPTELQIYDYSEIKKLPYQLIYQKNILPNCNIQKMERF